MLPKKPKIVRNSYDTVLQMLILKQTLIFIVIWDNGIYIHMSMCLCVFTLYVIIFTIFWLSWLSIFVSIKSNLFDIKSDDFCLLKIWTYELLLINIKQKSVQQSTISAYELPYRFLRILSIFRGTLYFLSLATVVVDINVETLKQNGILLSQFAQNIVEARF